MSHSSSNTRVCQSNEQCRRGVQENNHAKLNSNNTSHCATVIKVLLILQLIRPMTHAQGQEVHACYMDGIPVKISEQYKPPPRISLPMSYAQRLTLNKQLQDSVLSCSFEAERRAQEQLAALKALKTAAEERRKLRTARLQEEARERKEAALKAKEAAEKKAEVAAVPSRKSSDSEGILQPVQVKSCAILTPIPLNNSACARVVENAADRSPFNISDFEADTSSPFDNMELKTLNDMEELALVLRSESTLPTYPVNNMEELAQTLRSETTLPTYPAAAYPSMPAHAYYNTFANTTDRSATTNSFIPSYAQPVIYNGTHSDYTPFSYSRQNSTVYNPTLTSQNFPGASAQKIAPNVLETLDSKLSVSNGQCSGNLKRTTTTSATTAEDPGDPFAGLPKHLQDLTLAICTMGFPRGRVARACQLYGDDHKKVVEYLLALTELMNLGFTEKNVSNALHQCNNDRDKALDKLIL